MKMPPIEKVFEAYSAIADGRIEIDPNENKATVTSSDRSKTYTIIWEDHHYASDDNATYWAGYPGYPEIAVLMKQGVLPYDGNLAEQLKSVNWKELNQKYRRKYEKAAKAVMEEKGIDASAAYASAEQVLNILQSCDLSVGRAKRKKA